MQDRRSITALVLYIVGGVTVVISLFLTSFPTPERFNAGLIGLLLGVIILALGRITAHLSRIRDVLEGRR
ncbi:MAG: hypothetical protein RLY86_2979 [Pseudomonadota bacterium]|jgi:uncharacterized membrane protein YczE